jgi:hypothetical protein
MEGPCAPSFRKDFGMLRKHLVHVRRRPTAHADQRGLTTRRAAACRPLRLVVAGVVAVVLTAADGAAHATAQQAPQQSSAVYIVQLAGPPAASYTGGVPGIARTKPATGGKLNRRSSNFQAYRRHQQAARLATLRAARVDPRKTLAEYGTAFNGFAARLSADEAARLRRTSGVVTLHKNELHTRLTSTTPRFLGLDGAGGAWQRQFSGHSRAGEGVIVATIDSGFWPEHPSFAPLPEPRPDQPIIDAKWSGRCDSGTEHPVTCNNKVIGARYYDATNVAKDPGEFLSPRDFDSHGSHTVGIAAGNHGVPAVVNGVTVSQVSGMAPAARIAVYKTLWHKGNGGASASTVDSVSAIDDAVADGVDVINFSIAGGSDLDPVEIAFFHAAAAGVFVAASGGNGASTRPTVIHSFPWDTTVAASTHDRSFYARLTLGDGRRFLGAATGPALAQAPLVDAVTAATAGTPPGDAELCLPGSLDPAKVTGKIVVCLRGINIGPDKSKAVQQAGGVGMIMYQTTPGALTLDFHFVPTVHVGPVEGQAIKAYIAGTAEPTAAFSEPVSQRAPAMRTRSSVGPARSSGGDLLKPDITAPGEGVLAAVPPVSPFWGGRSWALQSGTSMSSPHIAGIAALLRSKHPTWSPMAIKSAMMTTAGQLDSEGKAIQREGRNATPHDFGSGHVRPGNAFDPGLVYESGPTEWLRYLCGIDRHLPLNDGNGGTVDSCSVVGSMDPSDLNYPSIAIGDLTGRQTITRTVTNVTGRGSVYLAKVEAPAGFAVKVTPSTLVLQPGKSASFTVEIIRTGAALGAWSFGSMSWLDVRGNYNVRSPIAVRAVPLAAPARIDRTGASGTTVLPIRAGFTGTLTAKPFGLVPADITVRHLVGTNTSFDSTNPQPGPAVGKVTTTVPAGTKAAQVATFDTDYRPNTDLDLYAYKAGTAELVTSSAGATAREVMDLLAPGDYDIYVVQYALDSGVTEQDVKLHTFMVGPTPAGNLSAVPPSQPVTAAGAANVTVTWTGLTAGTRYLGVVEYGNGSTVVGRTVIAIAP